MTTVRRVITGEADGKAVFTKVEDVAPFPGTSIYGVWGFDETPLLPINPAGDYDHRSVFPPPGGMRINVIVFPPQGDEPAPPAGADKTAWNEVLTAIPAHRERGPETRFVKTDSIDIGFVIEGEVVVEADDGVEVTLKVGDVYVQNGARHHWVNRSPATCVVGCVVLPATRPGEDPL